MGPNQWIAYYEDRVRKAQAHACQTERAYKLSRNINGICKLLIPIGVVLLSNACVQGHGLAAEVLAGAGVTLAAGGFLGFKFFETNDKVKALKDRNSEAHKELRELESILDSYYHIP